MSADFPSWLKAVIFDLDGTLLDTAPEFVAVVQRLREEHGLAPLDAELVKSYVSDGARAMCSLALDMAQEDPRFESKRLRFLDIYAEQLGSATTPYPGIVELLQELQAANISWGISTNKPSYLTEPLLHSLALQPAPASVVCPDHVAQPKPHPEPLLLNCTQLACDARQAIYIGDHRRDIEAGRAAGMNTIAATYGYIHPEDDPQLWGADSVASQASELSLLLKESHAP
ncbi:MAG: HAD-IA family hydrolase [Halieaceae bacterium]